jgi:hypothetical protein
MRPQRSHHRRRDIVPAVHTARVSARQKEERRGRVHDDVANVSGRGRTASLIDFEPQTEELRGLHAQARSIIFATASFGET